MAVTAEGAKSRPSPSKMKANRRKAVGAVRGDDEELEKVGVKFVQLVADVVEKTDVDRPQHECSSHESDKKKEGEAKEDNDDEDDVLEEAMPLAAEERERELPRKLQLWKKEPGEFSEEHPFHKPVGGIGESACPWYGFNGWEAWETEPGRFLC